MATGELDACGRERDAMVALLRTRYGVSDERVLGAMSRVPRHRFVPDGEARPAYAYGDHPCTIGYGQTISQPYIVAYMTAYLGVRPGMHVLEVGVGCGYQSAVLAELGATVFGVELVPELADGARTRLAALGYGDIQVRTGDGHAGWQEFAPYGAVIGACATAHIPEALVDQLGEAGRMILPVGGITQNLVCVVKRGGRACVQRDIGVQFVPMLSLRKETR